MIEKIKKHKLILIFLLFILFLLFSNKVDASTTIEFEYEGKKYNTVCPYDNITNYVIVKCDDGVFRLSITDSSDVALCYNCKKSSSNSNDCIRYKDKSGNHLTELRYVLNGTNWSYSNGGWDGYLGHKITSFVFSNCDVYDSNCKNVIHKADKVIPNINIEKNEKTGYYRVMTDWFDIRSGSYDIRYFYGENNNFDPSDELWDFGEIMEEKENEEGKETIWRAGFDLCYYGIYSVAVWNFETGDYKLYSVDWTEEGLKGTEAEGCLDPFNNLRLYLDTSVSTPTVVSNWIDSSLIKEGQNAFFSISFNGVKFNYVNIECQEYKEVNGITYTRFYYKIFNNGTYTFKLTIFDENHNDYEVIETFNINSYQDFTDINGTDTSPATPFITAYADTNIIRFSTQTFKERITQNFGNNVTQLRYKALYIDEDAYQYFGDDYGSWILMDVGYEDYDKITQSNPYYFKTEFNFDDLENGDKFYFVFYDYKLGCYSNVTTFVLEDKNELLTVSQNITFNNDRFNKLYNFFSEHFGFLSYPLEFVINLLTRIFNIEYEEPVLHIPVLKVPTTDNVIFNGLDYNLKTMLEIPIVSNIYNIYLIAVDFCLVIFFIIHTKNTLEGVIGSNG